MCARCWYGRVLNFEKRKDLVQKALALLILLILFSCLLKMFASRRHKEPVTGVGYHHESLTVKSREREGPMSKPTPADP